ncbi:Leucine efflux protein [Moraxella lacunata]|uniref:Leucine efflux protein n=1 Tax=Moraxella lacunata TaxID=477 RepID=A0A378TTA6_MORLA|nr:Leucine efflux protein [Moraxella lacunata]
MVRQAHHERLSRKVYSINNTSFFVQFVSPTYDKPFLTFFVLAVILQLVSFLYLLLLVFSGKKLADVFSSRPIVMTLAMFGVGCLFIGFGVNLWLAKL